MAHMYNRPSGNSTHGQNTITHYYDKAGIKASNEVAIYTQFADRKHMPLRHGTTYKISKWMHIYDRALTDPEFASRGYITSRSIVDVAGGLDGIALSEGATTGKKQTIQKVTLETTFARYGEMMEYTDEVDMFSEDAVQVRMREELGRLANVRYEDLLQRDLLATPTVMYSGMATSMSTIGGEVVNPNGTDDDFARVSYDLFRKAVRKLVRNRAEKNTSIVTGSTKIGTTPVSKSFYAIIGAEVKYDLESLTRGGTYEKEYVFYPVSTYADAATLAEGEVGSMGDVRFIESEMAMRYSGAGAVVPANYAGELSTTTLQAGDAAALTAFTGATAGTYTDGEERFDVFPILFPTKGSFATVGLKGQGKIKFNSQSPSKIELNNPFGTQGFMSYNMWYASIILREERLLKVLVAASA